MRLRRICCRVPNQTTAVAVLGLALGFGGGCSQGPQAQQPVVSVQTALVSKKNLKQIVSAEAVLYPIHEAAITPKVSAPVREFYVQRGSNVHRGQLLAKLENQDLEAAAVENKGLLEQAQANYESTTAASLPEELQKADLDVQSAKQVFDAQQKLYESRQDLYKQGALPRKDLDQAEVAYVQAKAQYEIASKHRSALQSIGKEQELKSAAGQLSAAKGRYLASQAQLGYTEIRSPIDGVVADRPLYPGETATAGTPLITVMQISKVVARAHIPEEQASLLAVGDAATISTSGVQAVLLGKVTVVSPATDPNSTTVEIRVEANNPDRQFRPGSTVAVAIVAKEIPDATVIPAVALLKSPESGNSVMVVGPGDRAHHRVIQVGVRQGDLIQVTAGLKPGERVVTSGAYGLSDNTKVRWDTAADGNPGEGE